MNQTGDAEDGQVFPRHAGIVHRFRPGCGADHSLYGLGHEIPVGHLAWDDGLRGFPEWWKYEYSCCFE